MGISRATYYYKPKDKTYKNKRDKELCKMIRKICYNHPYYGYRRVRAALMRKKVTVSRKKVLKLMKIMGIQVKVRKKYTRTTDSRHNLKVYPNLIKNLTVERINQLWCSDITYIALRSGFTYLAAIIDAFSRRIVGYCLAKTLAAEIALNALKMAIKERNTDDLIHHSDKGIQYCCSEYINLLKENNIKISMSAKGMPVENAFSESFFGSLKVEEIYMWEYETYTDAVERIPYFIEEVYNRKRLHSSLGYMPPEEFENKLVDDIKNSCKIYSNDRLQCV
jgi:transposase InsO family protein